MGILANLQKSFALALKPSQFVQWIDAVSGKLDGLSAARTTLVNGVSPVILTPLAVTGARIFVSLAVKEAGNVGPVVYAKAGDVVPGVSFRLTSTDLTGATVATDQSQYDWLILDT